MILGCLLTSAAVVHLVMVPGHAGEWMVEGIGFAIVGWAQLGLALAVAARCRRWALWVSVAVNAVALGAWIISRTSGFPLGPHADHAEAVMFIDSLTVAIEGITVVLAVALLSRRHADGDVRVVHRGILAVVPLAVVPLAIVALTTAALASPSARTHAHDAHGEHNDVAAAAAIDDAHEHAPLPAVDRPVAAATASNDAHEHPTENVAASDGAATAVADDKGFSLLMNGHQHTHADEPMDAATTTLLAHQLARTSELVAMYPTVAAAEAAGYHRFGPFAPGLGTHYGKGVSIATGVIDETNVLDPMLIYDGSDADSRLIGFMYIAYGSDATPEGFAGPNDIWHFHTNVCIVIQPDGTIDAPLGADVDNVDPELCQQYGGFILGNSGYMLHVWMVPGWSNPLGVFHETHPAITCADDTYFMKDLANLGFSLSTCRDAA